MSNDGSGLGLQLVCVRGMGFACSYDCAFFSLLRPMEGCRVL